MNHRVLLFFAALLLLCWITNGKQGQNNRPILGSLRMNNQQRASLRKLQGPQRATDVQDLDKLKEAVKRKIKLKEREKEIRDYKLQLKKQKQGPNLEIEGSLIGDIVNNIDLTDRQQLNFERNGHIRIDKLFKTREIESLILPEIEKIYESNKITALRHKIEVTFGGKDLYENPIDPDTMNIKDCEILLSQIDQENIPFMQLFNSWKKSKVLASIALNPSLGKVASKLLGVEAVRLYQDSIFVKRAGDGPTQWHSDLSLTPFDTNDMITVWIPLQTIPSIEVGGSGLLFASASHKDFAFPFWHDAREDDCSGRYEVHPYDEISVGDCTFHHGWTLHSSPENALDRARYAYAVSYIADGACLLNKDTTKVGN